MNKAAVAVAPSPERTEPDPPSADEAARLLNAAWSDREWGLHLRLIALLSECDPTMALEQLGTCGSDSIHNRPPACVEVWPGSVPVPAPSDRVRPY